MFFLLLDQQNSYQTGSNDQNSTTPLPTSSFVPKLIDNKRKQLERRLSAAKRDAPFTEESKNDKVFRKELTNAIKESTTSMAQALLGISQSMVHVSTVLGKGMELMARQASYNPQVQNLGYVGRQTYPTYCQQNESHSFNPAGGPVLTNLNMVQNFPLDPNYIENLSKD